MGRVQGKVVLLTGGSQGMGAAHARTLLAEDAKVVEFPLDMWRKTLDINLTGLSLGMQTALPAMAKSGGDSIIDISSVLEEAILVHASDDKGKSCYCPWILVTTDTALIPGRELLGFPKKNGTKSLIDETGKVTGIVSRKDVGTIRIEAVLGTQESPEATPSPVGRTVNVIGTTVEGMKFIDIPPMPAKIHRSQIVQAEITLTSSKTDSLEALEAKPDCPGRHVRLDFGGGTEAAKIIGALDESWGPRHYVERAFWRSTIHLRNVAL